MCGVAQERIVKRKGSTKKVRVGTRFIVTSSVNLNELVKKGLFLEQLLYKISVLPITILPLRERGADVIAIAQTYCKGQAKEMGKTLQGIEPEFNKRIAAYSWPGNIWELQNAIEYSVNMLHLDGILTHEMLPPSILEATTDVEKLSITLDEIEKEAILHALSLYGTDADGKKLAAEELGIGIATLYRKIKKLNIKE